LCREKIKIQYHKFINRGVSKNKGGKEDAGMLIDKGFKENLVVKKKSL
jgi:hypothetical protein